MLQECSRKLLQRFSADKSGNVIITGAIMMPMLIGLASLGSEAGLWAHKHRKMQGATDSAALSASNAYSNGNQSGYDAQAKSVVGSYGFVDGTDGIAVQVNRPPATGSYASNNRAVEVLISQQQKRLLSAVWASDPLVISARSVALANDASGCVLSLNPTARSATSLSGGAVVKLSGCSLYDNSSDATALTLGGSAKLTADSVGVVGGISGESDITAMQGINKGLAPINDPYASSSFTTPSGCLKHNYTAKTTVTLSPGVYCGGLDVNAGAIVTLNPGVYYMDGGDFTVRGGGTVTGTGVTMVFTSTSGNNYASATINGSATVNLTAPTSGPLSGIVMFGDRNMPEGTTFRFEGGAGQSLTGAVYIPKGDLKFAGGVSTGRGCTQVIGSTLTFTGNSDLQINCSSAGTKQLGPPTAVLVE